MRIQKHRKLKKGINLELTFIKDKIHKMKIINPKDTLNILQILSSMHLSENHPPNMLNNQFIQKEEIIH
jgi:hypothetical protein